MLNNTLFTRITLIALLIFAKMSFAKPEQFLIDNQHSYILWSINHLGYSNQVGKCYVNGEIVLDKDHPHQSWVKATIRLSQISTGLPELDKHLKGALFFNVKKYPTAQFVSKKVQPLGDDKAKVTGVLSMHGVSKTITLDVLLNKQGLNPVTNKVSVGFSAFTVLKRSDYGMTTLLPDVGDEVTIQIGTEAYQKKK